MCSIDIHRCGWCQRSWVVTVTNAGSGFAGSGLIRFWCRPGSALAVTSFLLTGCLRCGMLCTAGNGVSEVRSMTSPSSVAASNFLFIESSTLCTCHRWVNDWINPIIHFMDYKNTLNFNLLSLTQHGTWQQPRATKYHFLHKHIYSTHSPRDCLLQLYVRPWSRHSCRLQDFI